MDIFGAYLWLLKEYKLNKESIDFLKDLVYFGGLIAVLKFLENRKFSTISEKIRKNLEFREKIEEQLNKYVYARYNNGGRDIGIRLVHWKNYPLKLEKDAYNHLLFIRAFDNNTLPYGYIDNTGINFQEHLWFSATSLYLNDKGIFFADRKSKNVKGFKEIPDCVMIFHLPFENILDFDFKEFTESEPVFYTKFPFNKPKKLFSSRVLVREKLDTSYLRYELDYRRMLRKFSFSSYYFLRLKIFIFSKVYKIH